MIRTHKVPEDLDKVIDNLINEGKIFPLTEEQRAGVHQFWQQKLSLINGKPGSGKSEVIKAIELTIQHYKPDLRYAKTAPTGIATQRLGDGAKTNHSLLGKIGDDRPYYNSEHPLPVKAVIGDEAGMMDVFLTKDLFLATPDDAKILLIGDYNQLAPVGPGEPFRAFVEAGVPCVTLTKNLRSGEGGIIDQMTTAILEKDIEKVEALLEGNEAFIFYEKESLNDVIEQITMLYQERERLILTPYRETYKLGSIYLNQYLQQRVNPVDVQLEQFRLYDRVIQVENNKERNLSNGDRGIITAINLENLEIVVTFERIGEQTYSYYEALQEIELARALTVHKTQGIELSEVILPIFNETDRRRKMWNASLLYTAISRAKEKVHLVGKKDEFLAAILKDGQTRNSDLTIRLKKRLERK